MTVVTCVLCSACPLQAKTETTAKRSLLAELPESSKTPPVLIFGVAPTVGHNTMVTRSTPLATYLERKIHIPVHIRVSESYSDLINLIQSHAVHIATLPPLAYVMSQHKLPIVAIASASTGRERTYFSYLVVNKNTHYRDLSELRGKTIAWVSPLSTSGYFYPRALMRWRGYNPETFFSHQYFAGNHYDVIRDVASGRADVGATGSSIIDESRYQTIADAKELRVIAKSARIPMDCVVVDKNMKRSLAEKIRDALYELDQDQQTSYMLSGTLGIGGFSEFVAEDYDGLAELLRTESKNSK